jgi:hypothetical protein
MEQLKSKRLQIEGIYTKLKNITMAQIPAIALYASLIQATCQENQG